MAQSLRKEDHIHIAHREGFCGGAPIINGTKFPVRSVVRYILIQGWTPEELVRNFDYLTLAQVYDALAYYYDHKEEIEEDIRRNDPEDVAKSFSELV